MAHQKSLTRAWARAAAMALLTVVAVIAALATGQWIVGHSVPWPGSPSAPPISGSRTAESILITENGASSLHAMLLTLPGARADHVEPYIVDGTMRNLALLASSGLVTEYVVGVDPASPAVSHTSLAAGSLPRVTGVVGERFRTIGQPVDRPSDAGDGVLSQTPPLWNWDDSPPGTRDAVLFWPGAAPTSVGDDDIFVSINSLSGSASVLHIDLDLLADRLDGLPASFSPYLYHSAAMEIGTGQAATLWVVALDTRDDARVIYDALGIALSRQDANQPGPLAVVRPDGWAILTYPGQPASSVAFTVLAIEPDDGEGATGVAATLYQSETVTMVTRPANLAEELAERIGPPVPAPRRVSTDAGAVSPEAHQSLIDQRFRWQVDALALVQEQYDPRLMLASLDIISLLPNAGSDSGRNDVYDPLLRAAYRTVDQAVGRLLAGLDLSDATVVIGSPHGYALTHTAVNMRSLLDEIHSTGSGVSLAAYSSGGAAHIVVNQAGREPGGTVSSALRGDMVQEIIAELEAFMLDGEPAFARIVSGSDLRDIGLDSPNSGDVFVQAMPGIELYEDDPAAEGRLWWFVDGRAAGYAADSRQMRGIFVMAGRRIPDLGMVAPIHLADIAPTVAEILGIPRPAQVEGRVLYELLGE